jgi:hypothetical protein
MLSPGINSLIKAINTRARNLSLVLLDARVRGKKALGLGVRGSATGFAHRRQLMHRLHKQAVDYYEDGVNIQGEVGRWAVPRARCPANVARVAKYMFQLPK